MKTAHRSQARALHILALVLGLLGAGCKADPTDHVEPDPPGQPDPPGEPGPDPGSDGGGLIISLDGRLERGLLVRLTLSDTTSSGDLVGDSPSWSAEPADAVEFVTIGDDGDGTATGGRLGMVEARLLGTGAVTITGKVGERSGRIDLEVAAPPVIVFDMLRGGSRAIYRAALDGGDLVRLTSGEHDDRTPSVMGERVVFVSFRDGNGELYSMPLAGGSETRLTRTGAHEADPAISPDGKRLAFTSTATGVPKLWTAKGDATDGARATIGFGFAGSLEAAPSWAPDGERLVFVSTTNGTADLFLYTPATSEISPLVVSDAPEVEPAWSPDGEWIAFTSARGGQTDIYRVRIATGEVEQLTDRAEPDARPAWLRDGRIVYISWVDQTPRLRWLDPDSPARTHDVPLAEGSVARVSAVW